MYFQKKDVYSAHKNQKYRTAQILILCIVPDRFLGKDTYRNIIKD
jgi:hypothetical protein